MPEFKIVSDFAPTGDQPQAIDRLVEGVELARVEARYGVDVMARYGLSLQDFEDAKLLMHADGRLRLTRPGMLLANEVMRTFV